VQKEGRLLRVSAEVMPQIRVKPSEQLQEAVERLCGAGSLTLR
jgi:hypothetical protein